jgi:hypothetical protein
MLKEIVPGFLSVFIFLACLLICESTLLRNDSRWQLLSAMRAELGKH